MYKKILAALDGSQLSEGILPYARFFAKTLKVPVELLRVIGPETLTPLSDYHQVRYNDVMSSERKTSSAYLKEVAGSFSDPLTVECTVEVGKPAEIIVDRAAAHADTLIAMATHGRSGVKRWLLGSVADKVLHATANHLLLVRTTEETKSIEAVSLMSVLVPLDGSELAENVIPHAMELGKKMNCEIVLLRVFGLPTAYYTEESSWSHFEQLWEEIKEGAKDYLEGKVRQLKQAGVARVSSVLLDGDAAEKIIDLVREKPQSLVAMCTHGRSGINRWVLGSVTDRVVRHSGDPVLVIRASTDGGHSAS